MPYKSNFAAVSSRFNEARKAALIAGAELLVGAVKDEHRGGYTSGNFVTRNVINSIVRTDPIAVPGGLQISVTTTQTDPPYPVYWTLGHFNIFTKRFERVDLWTPPFARSAFAVAAEHERVMRERMAS
jgi:hypothetical protein